MNKTKKIVKLHNDCPSNISLLECQKLLIELSKKKAEKHNNEEFYNTLLVQNIKNTVEEYIRENKLVLYGGFAINALLDKEDKFYDEHEFPDYDMFSDNSLKHAKKMADYFIDRGFNYVQAKAGTHTGTFKVSVEFITIADITQMPIEMFREIQKRAILLKHEKLLVCPVDFLKMNMYLELSRPKGEISRWDKIGNRLHLLDKKYPSQYRCSINKINTHRSPLSDEVMDVLVENKCIFMGGLAINSIQTNKVMQTEGFPFTIFAENPEDVIKSTCVLLNNSSINIVKRKSIGELVPELYIVNKDKTPILYVYQTVACHAYITKKCANKNIQVRIATIDTMLTLYLAIWFAFGSNSSMNEILSCILNKLFYYRKTHLYDNFSPQCYGVQSSLRDILKNKDVMYQNLTKQKAPMYEKEYYFLNYGKVKKNQKKQIEEDNPEEIKQDNKIKRKKHKEEEEYPEEIIQDNNKAIQRKHKEEITEEEYPEEIIQDKKTRRRKNKEEITEEDNPEEIKQDNKTRRRKHKEEEYPEEIKQDNKTRRRKNKEEITEEDNPEEIKQDNKTRRRKNKEEITEEDNPEEIKQDNKTRRRKNKEDKSPDSKTKRSASVIENIGKTISNVVKILT